MKDVQFIYPTKKPSDKIDCVKLMRDIRDKLDDKLKTMTLEEEHKFLDQLIKREVTL